ncbi:cytochrome P450 [Tricholoma matsutake]|nr:cytochrome P450 [Tricholoma matsutake 945]
MINLEILRTLQWFWQEPERQCAIDSDWYMSLMNNVKSQMWRGTAPPSVGNLAIEKQSEFGLNNLETAYALSSPWMAGIVMLHYPFVMQKAQAELDSVIVTGQLPTFNDASLLPYVQALINETLRWCPIAPTGIPHAVTADNIYKDMFIPKGSMVYANIYNEWQLFPDPDEFRPEQFLNTTNAALINYTLSSGFGHCICPGIHLAQQSLFILLSRTLWAFDIVSLKDETGRDILLSENMSKVVTMEAECATAEATAWE